MEKKQVASAACYCVLLITSIVLFAVSFATLGPTEYGLDYNGNTFTIDETKVYENGRYLLGLGHWFVVFPKTQKTIKMSGSGGGGEEGVTSTKNLRARTSDGLQVTLDLSFQYKLIGTANDLVALYKDFEEEYEPAYVRISRDVIRNVASEFKAFEYFYNRTRVAASMREGLDTELSKHHCTVSSFQLLNIALPSKFANAIEQTEIARQEIEQASYQQQVAQTQANTRVKQAQVEAEIITKEANASAISTMLQASADAEVLKRKVESERQAFHGIKTTLGFDNEQLMAYIWLKAMEDRRSSAQNVIGVDKPAVLSRNKTTY